MLNADDAGLAEKLAMHVADVTEKTEFQEKHDNVSCKISFILSLLVRYISGNFKYIFDAEVVMFNFSYSLPMVGCLNRMI